LRYAPAEILFWITLTWNRCGPYLYLESEQAIV